MPCRSVLLRAIVNSGILIVVKHFPVIEITPYFFVERLDYNSPANLTAQ